MCTFRNTENIGVARLSCCVLYLSKLVTGLKIRELRQHEISPAVVHRPTGTRGVCPKTPAWLILFRAMTALSALSRVFHFTWQEHNVWPVQLCFLPWTSLSPSASLSLYWSPNDGLGQRVVSGDMSEPGEIPAVHCC